MKWKVYIPGASKNPRWLLVLEQTNTNQPNKQTKQTHTENSLLRTMLRRKSNQVSGQVTIFPKPELFGHLQGDSLTFHHHLGWPQPSLILPEDCKQRCGPATDCLVTPNLPNEEVGEATFDGKQIGTILALVGHVWAHIICGAKKQLTIYIGMLWMLAPARVTTSFFGNFFAGDPYSLYLLLLLGSGAVLSIDLWLPCYASSHFSNGMHILKCPKWHNSSTHRKNTWKRMSGGPGGPGVFVRFRMYINCCFHGNVTLTCQS